MKKLNTHSLGIKSYFKTTTPSTSTGDVSEPGTSEDVLPTQNATSNENTSHQLETQSIQHNKPNQPPASFVFPKSTTGSQKQKRSCQAKWFEEFKWLDYDEVRDCLTCFLCKKHLQKLDAEKNKEDAFLSTGFSNWKKALTSFKEHQNSKGHIAALTFELTIPQCGNIVEMTNENNKKQFQENRLCLLKVIESIQYLGRQGLALRGDDNDENSNLMQLLKLRSADVPQLKQWLEKKTEKYTSHDVQNEILILMANQVIRDVADEIRGSFFATICDEYTDIANKEQLTLCLRWVDENFIAHEEFIGFYEVKNIKSDTIVAAIRDALLRIQISLEKCRGQCYDGASNMLGKKSGVAKQISDIQPNAFSTHCHCHCLSLSVKTMTKESEILSTVMDNAAEIAILVKFSPKRERSLDDLIKEIVIEDDEEEKSTSNKISKLSTTRWTVRANCFRKILDNYEVLYTLWNNCLAEGGLTSDIRSRIKGSKDHMETFDLFFGLKLGKLLYSHTDKLSQTLQKEKMSALSSKRIAMLTIETISGMRNQESFDAFYDLCLKESKKIMFLEEPALKRRRKKPRYSVLQYFEGCNSTAEAYYPDSPRDHFREQFYNAIDVLVFSVKERFDQPSFLVFEKLESLLLKALKGEDYSSEMAFVKEKYSSDVDADDLATELSVFKTLFKEKDIEHFYHLINEMKKIGDPEKALLDNVCKICKLLAVNPASSATAERTFSMARRVKTWMRSTMLPARFNAVAVLNFHKKRTDTLDLITIANLFAESNDNRKRIFGRFTENDVNN